MGEGMIYPTRPIRNAILDKGQQSLITIYFRVQTPLEKGKYLLVELKNYDLSSLQTCIVKYWNQIGFKTEQCGVFQKDNHKIFINFSQPISNDQDSENIVSITTGVQNPIDNISEVISVWTISDVNNVNYFRYDENWNFGVISFTKRNMNQLLTEVLQFGDKDSYQEFGVQNKIKILIEISKSVGIETGFSRIKLITPSLWSFNEDIKIQTEDHWRKEIVEKDKQFLYTAPLPLQISSSKSASKGQIVSEIETPNILSVVFSQALLEGSGFVLILDGIVNPKQGSNGFLSIFTMLVNANESIERNEKALELVSKEKILTVNIFPSLRNIPEMKINPFIFYKSALQRVVIEIELDGNKLAPLQPIQVSITGNSRIAKSSVHLTGKIKDNNGSLLRQIEYIQNNEFIIRNLAGFDGKNMRISFLVKFSKTDAQFQIIVSIYENNSLKQQIMRGSTPSQNLITNYSGFAQVFMNPGKKENQLEKFQINISPTQNDVSKDSEVQIFFTKNLKSSSLVGSPLKCMKSIKNEETFTEFECKIDDSSSDYNILQLQSIGLDRNVEWQILVTGIEKSSNSIDFDVVPYEFFGILKKDKISNYNIYFFQSEQQLISLSEKLSIQPIIDINNSKENPQRIYLGQPSFISVTINATILDDFPVLNTNDRVYFSLYSFHGFEDLVKHPKLGDQFPCGFTFPGTSCYYFEKYFDQNQPLLFSNEGAQITVVFPQIISTSKEDAFQLDYDLGLQLNANPLQCQTTLSLEGVAGSILDQVTLKAQRNILNLTPGLGEFLVLVTEWEFWILNTSNVQTNLSNGFLVPFSMDFEDVNGRQRYISLFPFDPDISLAKESNQIVMNQVRLPFSLDLPNLSMLQTDPQGLLICTKNYINSGQNTFKNSKLKSLSMSCLSSVQNIVNTECTINFSPAQQLQYNSKLQLNFQGLTVNTDECSLLHIQLNTTLPNICSVSANSAQLILSLQAQKNQQNLIEFNSDYSLTFLGVDFLTQETKVLEFQIRDVSGNIVLEYDSVHFSAEIVPLPQIEVNLIYYSFRNPLVCSTLYMFFSVPRQLYLNEEFFVDLGKDLWDVNQVPSRLRVSLFDSNEKVIKISATISDNIMTIAPQFRETLQRGNYQLQIDGIFTPNSNSNDIISIGYIRKFDRALVLQNSKTQTSPFPSLLQTATNPSIKLVQYFLTEQSITQFDLLITLFHSQLLTSSTIIISFPTFYTPALTNDPSLLHCKIDSLQIPCSTDDSPPFSVKLSKTPLIFNIQSTFKLTIFGILAPSFNNRYSEIHKREIIFLAIQQQEMKDSYSEYGYASSPEVLQIPPNFPYLRLLSVKSAQNTTHSVSTHKFLISTEITLPSSFGFSVIFPSDYTILTSQESIICSVQISTEKPLDQTCQVLGLAVLGVLPSHSHISNKFTIIINDVPTPLKQSYVDFSAAIISVFYPDKMRLLTKTNFYTNSAGTIPFFTDNSLIIINKGNPLQVTLGTFSPQIPIEKADGSKFATIMDIQFSEKNLIFEPILSSIHLGYLKIFFRVGVPSNLIEREYSASIKATERVFPPSYILQSNILIGVTSNPVLIRTPSKIFLPIGGCSIPFVINLTNAPFQSLSISLQYDFISLPEKYLSINQMLSDYALTYDPNTLARIFSLCASPDYSEEISDFEINFALGGDNARSYVMEFKQITVIIGSKTTEELRKLALSISVIVKDIKRISAVFNIANNVNGTLYYYLFVKGTNQQQILDLSAIKSKLKEKIPIQGAISDLPGWFSGNSEDFKMNLIPLNNIEGSELRLLELLPQTEYSMCYYFEDEFLQSTEKSCLDFKTADFEEFIMARMSFSEKVFPFSMNNFLCYIVRRIKTRMIYVVNSEGNSCSEYSMPLPGYFKFKGQTAIDSQQHMNIYVTQDIHFEEDPSLKEFIGLFDDSTTLMLENELTKAEQQFNIAFLQQGNLNELFTVSQATLTRQGSFTIPTINEINFQTVSHQSNTEIHINNLTLSSPDGQVYFTLEAINTMIYDPKQNQGFEAPILFLDDPSADKVVNCLNNLGIQVDTCGRIIYSNHRSASLIFSNLIPLMRYRIHCVVTNHFPITPIHDEKVFTTEVITLPFGNSSRILTFQGIVLLFCVFLFMLAV